MELFDLYNENRLPLNQTMVRGDEYEKGTYHMVVHVCIFNSQGQMLIQQRQSFKHGWPGLWDVSVGGCAISGDTSRGAAQREVLEEIGYSLDLSEVRPTLTVNFDHGFDDIYLVTRDLDISSLSLQYEEVQDVRWASLEEILKLIDDGTFVPYHKDLVRLYFSMRGHMGTIVK